MTYRTPDARDALDEMLRALAEAESRIHAPAHVEAAVLARWDAGRPARREDSASRRVMRRVAALAAGVTIVAGMMRLGQQLHSTATPAAQPAATLVLVGEPILADERVRLVRMRMPASTLTALGVRAVDSTAETVDLDVFVGEDGVARAIRIGM